MAICPLWIIVRLLFLVIRGGTRIRVLVVLVMLRSCVEAVIIRLTLIGLTLVVAAIIQLIIIPWRMIGPPIRNPRRQRQCIRGVALSARSIAFRSPVHCGLRPLSIPLVIMLMRRGGLPVITWSPRAGIGILPLIVPRPAAAELGIWIILSNQPSQLCQRVTPVGAIASRFGGTAIRLARHS
jgi:hypothetical protein